MKALVLLAAASVVALPLGGCGQEPHASRAPAGATSGAIAQVGSTTVLPSTVERIARAQGVVPRRALELAIDDALLAEQVRLAGSAPNLERYAERAAYARILLEDLGRQAREAGPPSDAELGRVAASQWWVYDRPELRRSVHAVVRVDPGAPAAKADAALELARRIHAAVQGRDAADAFIEAARAVPAGDLSVRAEKLLPVTKDGRVVDPSTPPARAEDVGHYAVDFASALFGLEPGVISEPFRTSFGYHVALLLEVLAPKRMPREQMLVELTPKIEARRAELAKEQLLTTLRERTPPAVERWASSLTKQVVGGR